MQGRAGAPMQDEGQREDDPTTRNQEGGSTMEDARAAHALIQEQFPDVKLDPELQQHVHEEEIGNDTWFTLTHPLVYAVPYFTQLNHWHNQALEQKRRALDRAELHGDWSLYIMLYERPYRLQALMEVRDITTDSLQYEEWSSLVRQVWMDTENVWQNQEQWDYILDDLGNTQQVHRRGLMDFTERLALEAMPITLEIHRGWTLGERQWGWSWTLDRGKAEWFARRFRSRGEQGFVTTTYVPKTEVLAYLTGRNEDEILIKPETAMEMTWIGTEALR